MFEAFDFDYKKKWKHFYKPIEKSFCNFFDKGIFNQNVHKICYIQKTKIENDSTWEGAFYASEWAKINSSWVSLVFFTLCVLLLILPNCFVWPI